MSQILPELPSPAHTRMFNSHARIQEFSSGGVQVSLTKKSSDNVKSAYFTKVKWSILKKSFIFQGSRVGPTFSRGGPIAYSL